MGEVRWQWRCPSGRAEVTPGSELKEAVSKSHRGALPERLHQGFVLGDKGLAEGAVMFLGQVARLAPVNEKHVIHHDQLG